MFLFVFQPVNKQWLKSCDLQRRQYPVPDAIRQLSRKLAVILRLYKRSDFLSSENTPEPQARKLTIRVGVSLTLRGQQHFACQIRCCLSANEYAIACELAA